MILWSEGLSQGFLGDPTCFVCRVVTFFNESDLYPHNSFYIKNIIKLIYRTSFIINRFLGFIYAPIAMSVAISVAMSVTISTKSGFLITGFFFNENDLDSGGLQADLNQIFIKY